MKKIVEQGRSIAYSGVNAVMIETYWQIGRRIVEQEQNGSERAEYGKQLIELLSAELTRTYGKGFSTRNLWLFKQFYLTFSDIEILHTRVRNLMIRNFMPPKDLMGVRPPGRRRSQLGGGPLGERALPSEAA